MRIWGWRQDLFRDRQEIIKNPEKADFSVFLGGSNMKIILDNLGANLYISIEISELRGGRCFNLTTQLGK